MWLKLTTSLGTSRLVNMAHALSVLERIDGGCFVEISPSGDGYTVRTSMREIEAALTVTDVTTMSEERG